jgi:hypothetical protein
MKYCPKCEQEKDTAEFSKSLNRKDGLAGWCKVCLNGAKKAWQVKNRDEYNLKTKDWRQNNPQKVEQYYQDNASEIILKKRAYREANRGKVNAVTAKYRAQKLKATPPWLTSEHLDQIRWFYETAKDLQWLSEESLQVDHIEPLQGKISCGLHVPWNLQILPKSKNCCKSNKLRE